MRALPAMATVAGVLGVTVLVGASCGDDAPPRCGDGVHDPGEECDDGNDIDTDLCTNACLANLPSTTRVKWVFNQGMANYCAGGTVHRDSCSDLGVSEVRVQLVGPTTVEATESCGLGQVTFQDLPNGSYLARIFPRDSDGALLTDAPIEATLPIGATTDHEVVVSYDRWIRSYTGSLMFKISWAGQDCSAASPPVAVQALTLEQNGSVVNISTQLGDPLDGNESPCRPLSGGDQTALMVPMGPATMTIAGRETGGGMDTFRQSFDTFVGAGVFNCILEFDVASTMPDAGVPDAGVPDAGVPDAGVPDAGVVDAGPATDAP